MSNDFIYAEQLKRTYVVFGHFYNLKIANDVLECRSVLDIKRKETSVNIPDIIVVMMNPGSSTPLDISYKPKVFSKDELFSLVEKEIIPTKPDNAQYQIMRLMEKNSWDFVRILNLSDLRNGNSGSFQTEFRHANQLDTSNPHCITHPKRKNELDSTLKSKKKSIIVAWGDINELNDSANVILSLDIQIIGLEKQNHPHYWYASPYLKTYKMNWLNEIQKKIKSELE